jgi:hypothetical protein
MYVAVTLWLGIASVPVRADLIPFDATGIFPFGTLSGTVTIDTTAGTVTAIDITISDIVIGGEPNQSVTYTDPLNQMHVGGLFVFNSEEELTTPSMLADQLISFAIIVPTLAGLVGYTGGSLEPGAATIDTLAGQLLTGQLTPAAVPEPSTAIVACFGAVAFMAYGWSRHRREQRRQAAPY